MQRINDESLKEQVFEALDNSLENNDAETALTRDPADLAREMLEYTTFDDADGAVISVDDLEDEEVDELVAKMAGHVKSWQEEQ